MGLTDFSISTDAVIGGVISLILLIFCILQSIYWYHIVYEFNNKPLISLQTTTVSVSKNTAQVLMILSIIGAIIVGFYMLYNGARWFYNTNLQDQKNAAIRKWMTVKDKITQVGKKFYDSKGKEVAIPPSSNFSQEEKSPYSPNVPSGGNSSQFYKPIAAGPEDFSPNSSPANINNSNVVPKDFSPNSNPVNINNSNVVSRLILGEPVEVKMPSKPRIIINKNSCNVSPKFDQEKRKLVCSAVRQNEPPQVIRGIYNIGNKYKIIGNLPNEQNDGISKITLDYNSEIEPEIFSQEEYRPGMRNIINVTQDD